MQSQIYLGMYINANLKSDEHINIMVPNVSSKMES